MADNKSCEGKVTTLECMECGFREVFTERQMQFNDGLNCYKCGGPVKPTITRPGEMPNNRRMKEKKSGKSAGKLTIDIDVTGVVKGLKAVQREAKKTIRLLKEVEKLSLKIKE
ncbi:Sir2 family NAD-dependent protein deacetylase [Caldifermentibacillus hisashii]|uniref:Sir2 family NAD-dependent protein deacetylase n=1 Tax=Caldifermentibacillus hisashii TaxID=996558 RepID=UPI001C0FADE8|nr:Sir2 family NAD-dependent protein deacetylase [Caldifermentibacillus hisashii]MBU5342280.1 hypothetical protein [Caldifermentibacillus hisashii]